MRPTSPPLYHAQRADTSERPTISLYWVAVGEEGSCAERRGLSQQPIGSFERISDDLLVRRRMAFRARGFCRRLGQHVLDRS